MTIRITQLNKTDSGIINESPDMAADMLNGDTEQSIADIIGWLQDEGYQEADGYAGWGTVLEHQETGEIISVTEA